MPSLPFESQKFARVGTEDGEWDIGSPSVAPLADQYGRLFVRSIPVTPTPTFTTYDYVDSGNTLYQTRNIANGGPDYNAKVSFQGFNASNALVYVQLWRGTVGSGTIIQIIPVPALAVFSSNQPVIAGLDEEINIAASSTMLTYTAVTACLSVSAIQENVSP